MDSHSKFGKYVVSHETTPKSREEIKKDEESNDDNLSFKLKETPSTRKSKDVKRFTMS
jgi:hypothetical protein